MFWVLFFQKVCFKNSISEVVFKLFDFSIPLIMIYVTYETQLVKFNVVCFELSTNKEI